LEKRLEAQGVVTGDIAGVSSGLPVGSILHDFELPTISGGTMTLSHWRGRKILLIFVSPSCSYSRDLIPELETSTASANSSAPLPVIVTTGDEAENRRMFSEHKVSLQVLLQREAEVASLYWINTTPAGYLVDENGATASVLYIGAAALLAAARASCISAAPQPLRGPHGFSRSLTESKITRDGLKAGTVAPDFTLPLLDGGEVSLWDYRGRPVLLVFSDPGCAPCNALAPRLEEWHQSSGDVQILMISRGDLEANRAKIEEHELNVPVALQRHWEISRAYGIFATPVAFWIDANGVLAADVAVGMERILKLAQKAGVRVKRQPAPAAR
jgi:peroxiredoxin